MASPGASDSGGAGGAEAVEHLVLVAQAGDSHAMEQLLRAAYPLVLDVCARILGHRDPLDAAQNALVAISQRIGQFDHRAKFSTWCYRIATNAALDELRRSRRHSDRALDDGAGALERIESAAPLTDRSVADRMTVRDALAQLPDEQREVFLLRELEGLSYEELAALIGVPVGTVRSRLARARGTLSELLDPRNFEPSTGVSPLGRQQP